jgi:uncharacterized BrkB/YihY/UPF0761 family membrane protein
MPLWEAPSGPSPVRRALFVVGAVLALVVHLLTGLPYLLFLYVQPEQAGDDLALGALKAIAGLTWIALGIALIYAWQRRGPWTFAVPIASFAIGWPGLGFLSELVPFHFLIGD